MLKDASPVPPKHPRVRGLALLDVTLIHCVVFCVLRVIALFNLRNLHSVVSHSLARLSPPLVVSNACFYIRHMQRQRKSCRRVRYNSMKISQGDNALDTQEHDIVDQGDARKRKVLICL